MPVNRHIFRKSRIWDFDEPTQAPAPKTALFRPPAAFDEIGAQCPSGRAPDPNPFAPHAWQTFRAGLEPGLRLYASRKGGIETGCAAPPKNLSLFVFRRWCWHPPAPAGRNRALMSTNPMNSTAYRRISPRNPKISIQLQYVITNSGQNRRLLPKWPKKNVQNLTKELNLPVSH